jgi:hypothetical protein
MTPCGTGRWTTYPLEDAEPDEARAKETSDATDDKNGRIPSLVTAEIRGPDHDDTATSAFDPTTTRGRSNSEG